MPTSSHSGYTFHVRHEEDRDFSEARHPVRRPSRSDRISSATFLGGPPVVRYDLFVTRQNDPGTRGGTGRGLPYQGGFQFLVKKK